MPFRTICTICEAEVSDPAAHTPEVCRDTLKAALDAERAKPRLEIRDPIPAINTPWVMPNVPYYVGDPPWPYGPRVTLGVQKEAHDAN